MIEQSTRAARGPQASVDGRPVTSTALVPAQSRVVSGQDWVAFKEQAQFFVKSKLLANVESVEAALTIMVTGYELGIPPMQALRLISVVKGKPVCAAELMAALVYRDHGDDALRIEDSTAERCEVSYKRRGWSERRTYAFTIKDAQTAGLAQRETWKNFPAAMLRARCISAVARMAFPDTISGLYTPEEIAPDRVTVTGEGEVVLEALPADEEPAARSDGARDKEPNAERRTPSAEQWTVTELKQHIQDLNGASLAKLSQWQHVARTYGVPVPARPEDGTREWLLLLYRAMHTFKAADRIRLANTADELAEIKYGAHDLLEAGEITQEQYDELERKADERLAQLTATVAHAS